MIRYYKLFDMLNKRDMKLSDLRKIISSATVAKLKKGEYISGEVIDKICEYLDCQPGDIMERITKGIDSKTGDEVDIADHSLTKQEPFEPDFDQNVYRPGEKDNNQIGFKRII